MLLVDEADALFGTKTKAEQNEDLRALLNAGWQRDRPAWRCAGPLATPTPFSTFAMAALAAIKGLPDTITDRAVSISLKRREPDEKVARFRIRRDGKKLDELSERLTTWARESERIDRLGEVEPDLPDEIEDRAADAWEPLLAIADAAGGDDWPGRARAVSAPMPAAQLELHRCLPQLLAGDRSRPSGHRKALLVTVATGLGLAA